MHAAHATAVLFDMKQLRQVNLAGIAALIDLFKSRNPIPLGACGMPARVAGMLRQVGLDTLIPSYSSVDAALSDATLRPLSLRGTRAVLLCAGKGTRARPMTQTVPKPMLDIAGRPILDHVLDHLERCGVHDVLLNPGHLGPVISGHYAAQPRWRQSLFFVNEGHWAGGDWTSDPIGSASTLKRMQDAHGAFDRDLIVMCGDALTDIDLPAMMARHRAEDAAVTIAVQTVPEEDVSKYGIVVTDPRGRITSFQEKPSRDAAKSRLANAGIYIFSPRVLDLIASRNGLDIAGDLMPAVMASGGHMVAYSEPFQWVDIGCGRDYAAALDKVLAGEVTGVKPDGEAQGNGQWFHETARVSRRASISGPVHVGAGAVIEAGAKIIGPATIGARTRVAGKTLIRSSHVMADTSVSKGAILDHVIASGHWAVDHRFADGRSADHLPLAKVGPCDAAPTRFAKAV
ncbi:hypothetical protein ATO11_10640 [Pseudaestuariivita atlantica]|uniref:STAS domain-containing protein n=1 Tax=Pseudaestuariivita atlantica TaxID=1317121 RepID=A0A0L1JPL0_9RHOB|nr:hypothetical protein ATO11_10640 [Pseudaestuariivita atlantica]